MHRRAMVIDAVRPGMVTSVMPLRQYDLNRATIEDKSTWLVLFAPRDDRTPAKGVTIERNRAIEIGGRDEQMVEAICSHENDPEL